MIDADEIHKAGWMPGYNWSGTVFEPIYSKTCTPSLFVGYAVLVFPANQNFGNDWLWLLGLYRIQRTNKNNSFCVWFSGNTF